MDYISQMLRLYFYEKGYTKEEIKQLLENNPFDENFVKWELKKKKENIIFAKCLKNKHLITTTTPIQEIVMHKDNSVGYYLENDIYYTECFIKDINKAKLYANRVILLKGYYPNEFDLIKRLCNNSREFITGICTNDEDYRLFVLSNYRKMLSELKNCRLVRCERDYQNVVMLTNKSK